MQENPKKIKYDLYYTLKPTQNKLKPLTIDQQKELTASLKIASVEIHKAVLLLICESAITENYKFDKKKMRLPYAAIVDEKTTTIELCHLPVLLQHIIYIFVSKNLNKQ